MSKRHHSAAVRANREWDENETERKPAHPRVPARRELDEDYDFDYDDWDYKPSEKIRRKTPHRDHDWN